MAKDGALHRLVEGLRSLLGNVEALGQDTKDYTSVEKAVPIARGTELVTGPAWTWLEKTGGIGDGVLVEPLLAGDRNIRTNGGDTLDVLAQNSRGVTRLVVLDCLRFRGREIAKTDLSVRRYHAACFVAKEHDEGSTGWTLCPAFAVQSRVDLATAWAWACAIPGSRGMVVKRSGPYEAGVSKHWITVRKDQPTAADVHVDGTNWGATQQPAALAGSHDGAPCPCGCPDCPDGCGPDCPCGQGECTCGCMVQKAAWDAATIDALPDASFAYIAPGGAKDSEGKTTPRSLRHLPYKGADGAVDLPHLRNALARLEQTGISAEAKAQARAKLEAAAKTHGVGKAIRIVKRDAAQRILLGVVHQPDVEDLQEDIISAPEIEKAAHGFLVKFVQGQAGLNLDHARPLGPKDAQLLEHYLAPVDFAIPQADGSSERVLKGSWLQAWRLSPPLWDQVAKGEYTGFSMGGYGKQTPV